METPTSMRGPSPEASGHTPGPWHIESVETAGSIDAIAVREGAYGLFIAAVEPHDIEHAHALANARLIAAAPELLEALRALLATSDLNFDSLEPDTVRAIQAARAVMAKVQS